MSIQHNSRPAVHLHRLCATFFTLCAVLLPQAQAAPESPFVAATMGVFDGPGNDVVPELTRVELTGPFTLENGAAPAAYGITRADYGSIGFAMQTTGGIDREVDGGSVWSDGFVVNGGSGSTTANLSSRVVGTVTGHVEMFHMAFVSDRPFDFQTLMDTVDVTSGASNLQLPNATRLFFTAVANGCGQPRAMGDCGNVPFENYQGPLALTFAVTVPVTYGETFYVLSLLGGGVGTSGGSADFFNSAHFGITAPAGATVATLSGSAYAAAVAEPAPWMLLVAGLGVGSLVARRRGAGSAPVPPVF